MVDLKIYEVEEHYRGELGLVVLKEREVIRGADTGRFYHVEEGDGWGVEGFLDRHRLFEGIPIGKYDHINSEAHGIILRAIEKKNAGEEVDFEHLLAYHKN